MDICAQIYVLYWDMGEGMDYHGDEVCCCPPRWSVLGLVAEQELALADLSQYGSLWRNVEKLLTSSAPDPFRNTLLKNKSSKITQNSKQSFVSKQWITYV